MPFLTLFRELHLAGQGMSAVGSLDTQHYYSISKLLHSRHHAGMTLRPSPLAARAMLVRGAGASNRQCGPVQSETENRH
jgi:hypothetical protein